MTMPVVVAAAALSDGEEPQAPLHRAAGLVEACWHLHTSIRSGRFQSDHRSGAPLESRTYLNLFGTSYGVHAAGLRLTKSAVTTRLLVLLRGRTFLADFEWDAPAPSRSCILSVLHGIVSMSANDSRGDCPSVAELACATRGTQTAALSVIATRPQNRAGLDLLKDAFVTICLDLDCHPKDHMAAASASLTAAPGNRWWFASTQIVVYGNGKACMLFNPKARLPGNVMTRAAYELNSRALSTLSPDREARIAFTLSEVLWDVTGIDFGRIRADFDRLRDHQPNTFRLDGIGRQRLHETGLPPIELFTIAVQWAGRRLTGRTPFTGQFVSRASRRYGHISVARVTNPDVIALIEALEGGEQRAIESPELFVRAVRAQKEACRRTRSTLTVTEALRLYLNSLSGRKRYVVNLVLRKAVDLLGDPKKRRRDPRFDVLLSHPDISTQVPVFGRPGVRLPYLNCFGMHYQIHEEHIQLTLMPSTEWDVPNERLVDEIRWCIDTLFERLTPRFVPSIADPTAP